MIDLKDAIIEDLKTDATLVGLVGSAIYGPPGLPANFSASKAVLITNDGGTPEDWGPMNITRMQVRCYGETAKDANTVWRAVYDAVARKGVRNVVVGPDTVRIFYSSGLSGPIDYVEPVTEFPAVLGYLAASIYEVPV